MAEILIGNIKGQKGDPGTKWFYGQGITGTSTTEKIFPESGVEVALVGDFFLSTASSSLGYTYMCTTPGIPAVAKWVYAGDIRGPQGIQGIQGPVGPMPALIDNFLTTLTGQGALDAAAGKTLMDKIDELNSKIPNFVYKNFSGNGSFITGIVIPISGIAIFNQNISKVDIHMSCSIENSLDIVTDNDFTFISMKKLKQWIGVNSISFSAYTDTRVTVTGDLQYDNYTYGRSGLRFSVDGGICRSYTDDLSCIGSWSLTKNNLYKTGNTYTIDIFGADYT